MSLPTLCRWSRATGVTARVLMGSLWGETAAVTQHSPTIYADLMLAAGQALADRFRRRRARDHADRGRGEPRRNPARAVQRSTSSLPAPPRPSSADSSARALLLGGGAFATPRHVWWNFVCSSRDRIDQAKEDWTARRFPLIPGDEEEWIPIPDAPKTVSYP